MRTKSSVFELCRVQPNLRHRRMGKYGNIDGIATLTNNPNATDNAKGTIGNKNGFWGNAVKMEEVGITEITEEHLVEIVEEMFTKE